MKSVYLIGDSIRFGATDASSPGYGAYVQSLLADQALVQGPRDNCRFAQYTLRYLHQWAAEVDAAAVDVVHWNNGLWDVLRVCGDEPLTPLDMYVALLRRVHARIRLLFPRARVIFATSTAVLEHLAKPNLMRYNAEIEAYNHAACALMQELGVEVNDLYALTRPWGEDMHADWVHYNEAGCWLLAEQVAQSVMR